MQYALTPTKIAENFASKRQQETDDNDGAVQNLATEGYDGNDPELRFRVKQTLKKSPDELLQNLIAYVYHCHEKNR